MVIALKKLVMALQDVARRPLFMVRRKRVRFGAGVKIARPRGFDIGDYSFLGSRVLIGPVNARIGRYCSIGPEVLIGINSHPLDHISTSAVFYSPYWGAPQDRRREHNALRVEIGNDVWIGARAIIMSGVRIGDGAVIAAMAVVTSDVEAYSVVAGIPARHMKYRFGSEAREKLISSRWWDYSPAELREELFSRKYEGEDIIFD